MKKIKWIIVAGLFLSPLFGSSAQGGSNAASIQLLKTVGDGDTDHLQRLLKQGADINARSDDGTTPLMVAAQMADIADLKLLLQKGARINAQAKYGETALTWAMRGYSKDADVDEKTATVQLLLAGGADVQIADARGTTPLMWAASFNELRVLTWLLQRGANVQAKDKKGRTVVYYAAGEPAALRLLLAHGAR